MEILNNKIVKRDGNECLLTDAIALIRITFDFNKYFNQSIITCKECKREKKK